MNALERLLAEELPTGEFGGPRSPRVAVPTPCRARTSATLAAEHRAVLEAAIDGWHWDEDPRHLRAVPNPPSSRAA